MRQALEDQSWRFLGRISPTVKPRQKIPRIDASSQRCIFVLFSSDLSIIGVADTRPTSYADVVC